MSIVFEISLLNITLTEVEPMEIVFCFQGVAYSLRRPNSFFIKAMSAEEELDIKTSKTQDISVAISSILNPSEVRISDSVSISLRAVQIEPNSQELAALINSIGGDVPYIQIASDNSFQQIRESVSCLETHSSNQIIPDLVSAYDKKEKIAEKCIEDMKEHTDKLTNDIQEKTNEIDALKSELERNKNRNRELRINIESLTNTALADNLSSNPHNEKVLLQNNSRILQDKNVFDQNIKKFESMIHNFQEDKAKLTKENFKLKGENCFKQQSQNRKSKLLTENKQLKQNVEDLQHTFSSLKSSLQTSNNILGDTKDKLNNLKSLSRNYELELKESEHKISILKEKIVLAQTNSTAKHQKISDPLEFQNAFSKIYAQSNINSIKAYYSQLLDYFETQLSKKKEETRDTSQRFEGLISIFRSENSSLKSSIDRLTEEITEKQLRLDSLEKEKSKLVSDSMGFTDKPIRELHSELQVLTTQLSASESKHQYSLKQASEIAEIMSISSSSSTASNLLTLRANLTQKDTEIVRLRRILKKYKTIHPNYIPVENDPIDRSLADFVNSLDEPLDVKFVREDHGIYFYGTKRVFISVEPPNIIVKVGDRFIRIQAFITEFTFDQLHKLNELEDNKEEKPKLYSRKDSKIPLSNRGSIPSKESLSRNFFKGESQIAQITTRPSLI